MLSNNPKNRPQGSPTVSFGRRRGRSRLAAFPLIAALICGVLPSVLPTEGLEVLLPPETYSWKRLGNPDDYTELCYEEEAGSWDCEGVCPGGFGAICAEFVNGLGHVLKTCCILPFKEGSLNVSDCLLEVDIAREPQPPELHPW